MSTEQPCISNIDLLIDNEIKSVLSASFDLTMVTLPKTLNQYKEEPEPMIEEETALDTPVKSPDIEQDDESPLEAPIEEDHAEEKEEEENTEEENTEEEEKPIPLTPRHPDPYEDIISNIEHRRDHSSFLINLENFLSSKLYSRLSHYVKIDELLDDSGNPYSEEQILEFKEAGDWSKFWKLEKIDFSKILKNTEFIGLNNELITPEIAQSLKLFICRQISEKMSESISKIEFLGQILTSGPIDYICFKFYESVNVSIESEEGEVQSAFKKQINYYAIYRDFESNFWNVVKLSQISQDQIPIHRRFLRTMILKGDLSHVYDNGITESNALFYKLSNLLPEYQLTNKSIFIEKENAEGEKQGDYLLDINKFHPQDDYIFYKQIQYKFLDEENFENIYNISESAIRRKNYIVITDKNEIGTNIQYRLTDVFDGQFYSSIDIINLKLSLIYVGYCNEVYMRLPEDIEEVNVVKDEYFLGNFEAVEMSEPRGEYPPVPEENSNLEEEPIEGENAE